jgi:hypothetical protein
MKVFSFGKNYIFLKYKSCPLKTKFSSSICRLKNYAGIKGSITGSFFKNSVGALSKIIFMILFFLMFSAFSLILFFLPVVFNIKEAQALPPSPFKLPLSGNFAVKFRQEYFDESEQITRKHTGVDIAGGPGDNIIASGNGIVSYTGFSAIGGMTVVIKHNDKIRTTYLNMLDCCVSKGDLLSQGDILGNIGADDDPSFMGPHLHFGIIYMDSYLDPEDIFNIDYASISRFISLVYIKQDVSMQIDRR